MGEREKIRTSSAFSKHEDRRGYRFAHVSSSKNKLPDLLYAIQTDAKWNRSLFK